ncbi:MAG: hypothetical protein JJU28_06955 [Cyclobacteriaceae bacterium]|nr:hypothetical protein [Cyclobacteriaceae bacterium]
MSNLTPGHNSNNSNTEIDQINISELLMVLWKSRKPTIKATSVFFILGIVIAFTSQIEYQSNCKLLPEVRDVNRNNLTGLSNLAGLAGINLDLIDNQGSLKPELYPQIVQSLPFRQELIYEELNFSRIKRKISFYAFFSEKIGQSFFYKTKKTIFSIFSKDSKDEFAHGEGQNIILISKEMRDLLDELGERIAISVDKKDGMISVSATMPDPLASAELTDKCVRLLQRHITDYKLSQLRMNKAFIKERFNEAEDRLQASRKKLAIYDDKNINVISSLVRSEKQHLENEYNFAFELYKSLGAQLEQSEIKVKEETPVFTIIEPVVVPLEKSKPKRLYIILASIIIGLLLSSSIQIFKFIFLK